VTTFIFDGSRGRDWSLLIPGSVDLEWLDLENCFDLTPQAGDILICHRVQNLAIAEKIREFAKSGNIVVVTISGNDVPREAPTGLMYRRAKSVSETSSDPHFSACFAFFAADFNRSGRPNWLLLEGSPSPDALLAYHLLGFLSEDTEAQFERERIKPRAIEEGRAIADAARASSTFDTTMIEDSERLRNFLSKHV
jgi:hypothetical protein